MSRVKAVWVRHRGILQSPACLLNVDTWHAVDGGDWQGANYKAHPEYYEAVAVPQPAHLHTYGGYRDIACISCLAAGFLLALEGRLEIVAELPAQRPLPLEAQS